MKTTWFFDQQNYVEKSTWKQQRRFFDHQNYIKKSKWKQRGFFSLRNYTDESTRKQLGFFDQQNYVQKVRVNYVDFSTIEILSKKYAEMTWKFVAIWSSTYRRNIHVESTWIRHGVLVLVNAGFFFLLEILLYNTVNLKITVSRHQNSKILGNK